MDDVFSIDADTLFEQMQPTSEAKDAMFNTSALIAADEGAMISGDDIADAIERAKANGTSIAKELRQVENASLAVTIEPGPGIVERAERSSSRKKKRD